MARIVLSGLLLSGLLLGGCLESPPGFLDGGPGPDAFACTGLCCANPVGALTDDFADGEDGVWVAAGSDPGCVVDEREGAVHLSNTALNRGCNYRLSGMLLAGGQTASIELVEGGDGEPNAEFRLEFRTGEKINFERHQSGLRVTNRAIGELDPVVVKQPVSYVPTTHRFLRFRGDVPGEIVVLETSPDWETWSAFYTHSLEELGTDDCVAFELGTFGPVGEGASDEVIFDNFNRPP